MKPPTECRLCNEPVIDEAVYKVGLCYQHAQSEMLRVDTLLVKLSLETEKLHEQSNLLQKAIHVHRNGLTIVRPAGPGADESTKKRLQDLLEAATGMKF